MKDGMILKNSRGDSAFGLSALLRPHQEHWPTQTEIYLAVQNSVQRSKVVDTLVLDGFDASPFCTAGELWERFQSRPVRLVITERDFGEGLDGIGLTRKIRTQFPLPYVFIVMLSSMCELKDIKTGLDSGVDDYLAKPPHPRQLRTRTLIAIRWLQFIDTTLQPVGNPEDIHK